MGEPESEPTMELLSLKPSPYSQRVVWSLNIMKSDYKASYYTSIAGEPGLRWRLGRWKPWETATVPVGFIKTANGKEMALENGFEIVEWADERAADSSLSLVPKDYRAEVLEYCSIADDLLNFDRTMFLKALAHHPPSVLRAVAGDDPPEIALYVIAKIVGTFMRTKYRSSLNEDVDGIQKKAKELEECIEEKQKKNPGSLVYLVSDKITMADIFISVAVTGGVRDRSKPVTKNQTNMQNAIASQGFSMKEKFPVLYQWAFAISESEKHPAPHALFEE